MKDNLRDMYIQVIEEYLADPEAAKRNAKIAIEYLIEENVEQSDIGQVLLKSTGVNAPISKTNNNPDPTFLSYLDLEKMQRTIQDDINHRKQAITYFSMLLIMYKSIDSAIFFLSDSQKALLLRRYGDEQKMHVLAKEFGVSRNTISGRLDDCLSIIYNAVRSDSYDTIVAFIVRGKKRQELKLLDRSTIKLIKDHDETI